MNTLPPPVCQPARIYMTTLFGAVIFHCRCFPLRNPETGHRSCGSGLRGERRRPQWWKLRASLLKYESLSTEAFIVAFTTFNICRHPQQRMHICQHAPTRMQSEGSACKHALLPTRSNGEQRWWVRQKRSETLTHSQGWFLLKTCRTTDWTFQVRFRAMSSRGRERVIQPSNHGKPLDSTLAGFITRAGFPSHTHHTDGDIHARIQRASQYKVLSHLWGRAWENARKLLLWNPECHKSPDKWEGARWSLSKAFEPLDSN